MATIKAEPTRLLPNLGNKKVKINNMCGTAKTPFAGPVSAQISFWGWRHTLLDELNGIAGARLQPDPTTENPELDLKMLYANIILAVLAIGVSAKQTVYLIRHGEKPADGGNGLTIQGQQRAQCLRTVFGASSQYDIGYIIAQKPKADGSRERPLLTVQPVATDLGLTVDTSCDRDDAGCVATLIASLDASKLKKNILICWEHKALSDIVAAMGSANPPTYPDTSFNLIWTDPKPYSSVTNTTSEACPGLDGLHRSNAVHRRRRRTTTTNAEPSSLFVDDHTENDGEAQLIARTLTDGETVVDDQTFDDDWGAFQNLPQSYQRNGQNIVQLLFRVSEDATRRNAYVHRGCACNSCGVVPIRGVRYRCSNCADYDLCEGCESQGLHTKTHIFYKIKVPGPSFGPKNIQPVWYAGDPDSVMRMLPKDITTKLSRETGFERPELDAYWEQWTFMANTDWREDPDDINLAMDRKTFERCLVPSGGYRHTSPSLIFDRMFAFYDTNKDDLIGFPEFLHGIGYRKKKDKWSRIFDGYDIDGDGYADRKDFLRMFRSYYVLFRQMHRDMLEGMEEQHMSCTEAHRLVTSRQPLSSAFGQDGRYPRAPNPRTGEGKTRQPNGDLEITDGKGVVHESSNDTGNREDVFRQEFMQLSQRHLDERRADRSRLTGGYWETITNPPQTEAQMAAVLQDTRGLREHARDFLQRRMNTNAHPSLMHNLDLTDDDDDEGSGDESEVASIAPAILSWLPPNSTATDEDAAAIDGPGTRLADVQASSRQAVIDHAIYRERAQREIYDRWKRRQFYTDEEEGAAPPEDWKEDDDVLANSAIAGESSKSQTRPSIHSRSSSKVRFAEDMDDFDTRSNPSTSSRSVPERWGGMEIPDAERDAGKEILYQVTQQAFNELLDPFFKEKEDLAVQAAENKAVREKYRALYMTPEFEKWALDREAEQSKKEETPRQRPERFSSQVNSWTSFPEVEVEDIRQRPLEELLAATGYHVDITDAESVNLSELERVLNSESQQGIGVQNPISSGEIYQDPDTRDDSIDLANLAAVALSHDSTRSPTEEILFTNPIIEQRHPSSSPNSSLHQSTPPESPTISTPSSYRDPTLPQFRPNTIPPRTPHFSRFEEDLPDVHGEASTSFTQETTPHPSIETSPDLPSLPETPLPRDSSNRVPRRYLYQLWRCDNAATEAEERGGWGRLDYDEFEAIVKKFVREGKGNQMDYLGSWIDLCIP
ncbi:hypothetical protein G7Y89_g4369 [Cudoniella acicularis]|uniref:Uncharacterized protein n=1 Tax=Cudoniella acicularis TaxID=354080 RepID=A0A8H4W4S1_9HELO|nr:hypothetical protein G7Y89_g4369 [Cudoniella acicularis]